MENLKRRTAKDLENAHKFALDGFVKALLEVSDSLAMGIKSAKDKKDSARAMPKRLRELGGLTKLSASPATYQLYYI